jgi:hypothetical protein
MQLRYLVPVLYSTLAAGIAEDSQGLVVIFPGCSLPHLHDCRYDINEMVQGHGSQIKWRMAK